jgi:hypothetical protein
MAYNGHNIPATVELVYRKVGNTHVFSSRGIQGLVHVGSSDRETAFHDVIACLKDHVKAAYGCDVSYHCEMSYDQFAQHIDADNDILGSFLTVKLDDKLAA